MSLEKVAIRNGPIAQLVPGGNSPLYKLVIEHGALTGEIPEYITDYNLYYGPIAQLVRAPAF